MNSQNMRASVAMFRARQCNGRGISTRKAARKAMTGSSGYCISRGRKQEMLDVHCCHPLSLTLHNGLLLQISVACPKLDVNGQVWHCSL